MSSIRSTRAARSLVPLVLALALSGPARADVQAHGSLLDFQFQLTDLAPDDGVAPGYTMPDTGSQSGVSVGASLLQTGTTSGNNALGWLAAASGSAAISGAGANAWVQPDGLRAEGFAHTAGSSFYAIADTATHSPWVEFNLSLAPHTALTVSADYDLQLLTQHIGCELGCERASLTALLQGFNVEEPFWGGTQTTLSQDWTAPAAGELQRSGVLTLTLANDTDDWRSGTLTGQLRAEGVIFSAPPPVPEPATWALAGLGLSALAIRRRRRG